MTQAAVTLVTPAPDSLLGQPEALACLAFGILSQGGPAASLAGPRHLALLGPDALDLDLDDPLQRHFGDYHLLAKLGQGGMGVVYRARQESLDREVALKLLAAGPWTSTEFIERFKREAQSAARLQHPNIVPIFEIGSQDGLHYFSMRLVRGPTLAQVLAETGAMAPRQAALLLRTLCEALDYAHRLGVLHLDLKPGNVLIDEHDEPQVADFGLARRLDETLLTHDQDEVSGTPSYMAPEQAQALTHQFVPATDIYGLGAILYECLTGRPPFLAATAQETLRCVVGEEPQAPSAYADRIPPDLEAICLTCLAKDPARRYLGARALGEDLARFLEGRAVSVRPLNPAQRTARWARREPKFAAAVLLALIALLAGLGATTQQWRRAESNAATSNERLWESRRAAALRLQQDGKGFEAMTPLIANVEEQERAGRFDPGGIERRELGAILHQGVTLIDRMIVPDAPIMAAELSADGDVLALAFGDQTVRWYDTATLTERGRVDLFGRPTSDGQARVPRFLSFVDRHRLRVTQDWLDYLGDPDYGNSHLIDLDAGRVIEPPPEFAGLTDVIYGADGHHALLRNESHEVQLWQVDPWRQLWRGIKEQQLPGYYPVQWLVGPGARYLVYNGGIEVNLRRGGEIERPVPLQVFNNYISAWTQSADGAHVAIGDVRGRVFVVDSGTGTSRQLPTPVGREVTWLEFSEDDAWLAAARLDGAAFAFDVGKGDTLNAGQMQHDYALRHVALSRQHRMLVASGPGESGPGQVALWRLPEPGIAGLEPTRLLSSPSRNVAAHYSVGAALQSGLLVTAAIDGDVRLWRIAAAPVLAAHAARQVSSGLEYDGAHVPDVAHDRVRVASTSGAEATEWLKFPQPVNFAELVDSGGTLIVISGRELHLLDARAMTPRRAPLVLPASPMRLLPGPAGRTLVLAFGGNGATGFEERLEAFDLRDPESRRASVVLDGPLRQLELSRDGTRLLAVGPVQGSTDLFDAASLRRLGSHRHTANAPVSSATFAAGDRPGRLWLVTGSADNNPRGQIEALTLWDAESDAVLERRMLSGVRPLAVTLADGRPFVAGETGDLLDAGAPGERGLDRLARDPPTIALAIGPDGRLIARGFRAEVQLYDSVTGAPVGPALRADLDGQDLIAQLAFAPDGRGLLARSLMGRWALWPIGADSRAATALRGESATLNAAPVSHRVLELPAAAERALLRAADPGAWRDPEARPEPPSQRTATGARIPERAAQLDPLVLDLSAAYTLGPESVMSYLSNVVPHMAGLPLGLLTLDAVDYDVRGMVEIMSLVADPRKAIEMGVPPRAAGIRTPARPIAAFHVLMFASHDVPVVEERDYAALRVHYVDGGEALLPIRTQRDVPGGSERDRPTPFGWAFGDVQRLMGYPAQRMLSNPRLPNPEPGRLVATIDIETAKEGWSNVVVFAITAEPVTVGADSRNTGSGQ